MSYVLDGVNSTAKQTTESRDASGNVTIEENYEGLRTTLEGLRPATGPYRLNGIDGTPAANLTIENGSSLVPVEPAVVISFNLKTKTDNVPLAEHERYKSDLEALDADELSQLKRFIDGQTDVEYVPVSGDLQEYIKKMLAGITSFARPHPVLLCEATYQIGSSFRPNPLGVGKIFTTAMIRAAWRIASWDSYLSAKLPNGEWLAEDLDYSYISTGQRRFQQSFRYALDWDDQLYEHPTSGILVNVLSAL